MGMARATFYDEPIRTADDTAIVAAMAGICDEYEHYGWRRAAGRDCRTQQQNLIRPTLRECR
jgi:hypothetical protein